MNPNCKFRVLAVDDDPRIHSTLMDALDSEQADLICESEPSNVMPMLEKVKPDLIILDIEFSGQTMVTENALDGIQLLRGIRAISDVPCLMLSNSSLVPMKVLALEIGADDYMTKPFSKEELKARLNALRRGKFSSPSKPSTYRIGNLTLDKSARKVFLSDTEISLTQTEFSILLVLMRNAGNVLSLENLAGQVLVSALPGQEKTLTSHISRLRKKLRTANKSVPTITSIYGAGYRLENDDSNVSECLEQSDRVIE